MDEKTFREELSSLYAAPAAPEKLVSETIRRAQAVSMGRDAEERLAQEGAALPQEEQRTLLAQGMIGRYAMHGALPAGVSPQQAAEQLAGQEAFRRAAGAQPAEALDRLQSGRLLQEVAGPRQEEKQAGRTMDEPSRQTEAPRMEKEPPKNTRMPGMFR